MSVLKYFKNTPSRPPYRATGLKCNFFFFKFAMRSLKKKALSPPQRATGACRPPLGRQAIFFQGFFFPGTYFELFECVFVIIVGKISAANSYRT